MEGQQSDKWMEFFYSKPSMAQCYFLEKLPSGEFAKPSEANQLRDASHIRPGFRVMRRHATHVEFALTNGTDRNWDDNSGLNYVVDGVPGRYVVEHGIRRVSDVDVASCTQDVMRRHDQFVHLRFRADLWARCFCNLQGDGTEWTTAPGVEMSLMERPNVDGRNFELVVRAQRLAVAFNDGEDVWDGNSGSNYLVGLPGFYDISSDKGVVYLGPSEKDLKENPSGSFASSAPAPVAKPQPSSKSTIPDPVAKPISQLSS